MLPEGSIGVPSEAAGLAAMSALDEALTPEDMEAILPTDSPARLLYGVLALRKMLTPQARLAQWAASRCRFRIQINGTLELSASGSADGCRAHELDAQAEEGERIRWRRKFYAGGVGVSHLIKAFKAAAGSAAYGSTRTPEEAAVAMPGSPAMAKEGAEWQGEPGAWRASPGCWASSVAAAECLQLLQSIWCGAVLPILPTALGVR